MKIQIASDLHTEFGNTDFPVPENSKDITLVLAGDIGVGEDVIGFINNLKDFYKNIIYVAGNHEFYRQELLQTVELYRETFRKEDNIFFLEKDHIILEDVLFFGATFWTPGGTPLQNLNVLYNMSDFSLIHRLDTEYKDGYCKVDKVKVTPDYLNLTFTDTVSKLEQALSLSKCSGNVKKVVVVSHHAPSVKSSLPRYEGSDLNPFFFFNAEEYIDNLNQIDLWVHGHMHNKSDYLLDGGTRVICNPRGYIGENLYPLETKLVEI